MGLANLQIHVGLRAQKIKPFMLIKAAQLLLSLSILVVIHELGHFLAARMFKTRVEKFYLFFDFLFPVPTLLNFALFKKKIGDTEYGIGWFPLGGYVKIAGMADESMDDSYLNSEPKPDEYRSKKNWQKLIIMLGGIIMNVLLGWLIYSQIVFWSGEYSSSNCGQGNVSKIVSGV